MNPELRPISLTMPTPPMPDRASTMAALIVFAAELKAVTNPKL